MSILLFSMESSSQSLFSGYTFPFSMFVDETLNLHWSQSFLGTPVYDCLVNISNKAPPGLPDFECARQVLNLLFADVFRVSDANCISLSGRCLWGCPYHSCVYANPRPVEPGGSCLLYLQGRSQAWLLLALVPYSLPISIQVTPRYFSDLFQGLPGLC